MRLSLVLVLLLAACASLPPPELRPLSPEEANSVASARAGLGSPGAERAVRGALGEHPESVDLARMLQNLRFARGEGWTVYEDARRAHEAEPGSAGRLYLLGRTIPDRELQEETFERALDRDPSLFFANYGLAVVRLERGDPRDSERFARRALAIRPGNRDARVALARALARGGAKDEAKAILSGLRGEDPADAGAAIALAEVLRSRGADGDALDVVLDAIREGAAGSAPALRAFELLDSGAMGPEEARAAAEVAREAGSTDPDAPATNLLLGRALLLSGEPRAALAAFDRAVRGGARADAVREDSFRAAVLAGEYVRALGILEAGWPTEVLLESGNRQAGAVTGVRRALAAAGADGSGGNLAALSRALSAVGFEGPAAAVARRAAKRDDAWRALADDAGAWEDFLTEVRDEIRAHAREYLASGTEVDLSEILDALAAISVRRLGRDVVSGMPVDSWTFAGSVARSDTDGAPAEWMDRGTLLVVGRRSSGPILATMMRVVGRFRMEGEREGPFDLLMAEGQSLRSHFDDGPGRFAGFTLPGWVVLNLDVVNGWEGEVRRLAAEELPDRGLWPAPDRERRLSTWFPGGVRQRLARQYVSEAGDRNGSLASSLAHERGHLVDARRYLPVLPHLPAVLGLVVGTGFSVRGIEVRLEEHAESYGLMVSPWPRNALLNTIAFLPFRDSAPPHSRAYAEILDALLAEIDGHPELYPSVDRRWNLLQQLSRLTDAELRLAVQRGLGVSVAEDAMSFSIASRSFAMPAERTSAPSGVTSTVSSIRTPMPRSGR